MASVATIFSHIESIAFRCGGGGTVVAGSLPGWAAGCEPLFAAPLAAAAVPGPPGGYGGGRISRRIMPGCMNHSSVTFGVVVVAQLWRDHCRDGPPDVNHNLLRRSPPPARRRTGAAGPGYGGGRMGRRM